MTATELYAALQGRDVRLSVHAGRLRVDAPDGVLSEQEWTLLAAHKAALVAILTAPVPAASAPPTAPELVPATASDTTPDAWADQLAAAERASALDGLAAVGPGVIYTRTAPAPPRQVTCSACGVPVAPHTTRCAAHARCACGRRSGGRVRCAACQATWLAGAERWTL